MESPQAGCQLISRAECELIDPNDLSSQLNETKIHQKFTGL